MKIPRDVSGVQLARTLRVLGYTVTRQEGSHLRLTTTLNGQHHVTVPNHSPVKTGTLGGILKAVALHHRLSVEELLRTLEL